MIDFKIYFQANYCMETMENESVDSINYVQKISMTI